jgi:hypothetical protein
MIMSHLYRKRRVQVNLFRLGPMTTDRNRINSTLSMAKFLRFAL